MPENNDSTQQQPIEDPTATTQPAVEDSRNFKLMRQRAEKAEAEVKTLRTATAKAVAKAAGYDVDTGIAELVIERFVSEDRKAEDFTDTKFTEFATSLGLTAKVAEEPGGGAGGGDPATGTTTADQLDTLQQHADAIRNGTQQTKPQGLAAQIAEAEAKGDWSAAMSLKDQLHQEQAAPKVPA